MPDDNLDDLLDISQATCPDLQGTPLPEAEADFFFQSMETVLSSTESGEPEQQYLPSGKGQKSPHH